MNRDDFRCRPPSVSRLSCARWSLPLLGTTMLLFFAGCPGGSSTTPPAATGGNAGASGTGQEVDSQCANIVSSIHDMFQLQKLGQTTSVADGLLRLNDWLQSCGPKADSATELPDQLQKRLTPEQVTALQSPRFIVRDGEHLRDGTLFRSLVRRALEASDAQAPEWKRVAAAFQHVIRTIELVEQHPQNLPLTPYEIYLLGKGTAADRAWLFATLLRQVKIDVVLIVPSSSAGDGADPAGRFLVGAILDGETYLFDPRAGVAIPAPGATENPAMATGVATLNQAAENPEVLKQLDVDEETPYPIRAADLEKPGVLLISDVAFWSDRMRALQGQFSGENSMVLADLLQDTAEGPGQWTRVGKAGGNRWSVDSLRIWDYPESQLGRHAKLSSDQVEQLALTFSPFQAYATVRVNPTDGKITLIEQEMVDDPAAGKFDPGASKRMRTTKGTQMRARLTHVGGDLAQAVPNYFEVWQRSKRLVERIMQVASQSGELPIEQAKLLLHVRAMDDASFWMALCKFEQGNYRVAVEHLQRYRTQHAKGAWLRQSRYLLALSLAAQEDYQGAVDELEEVAADDPEYFGYQWLIQQWRSAEPSENAGGENGAKAGS